MLHFLRFSLKTLFLLILIIFNIPKTMSQEWNSARLTVLYGSNIPFNFNSIDKIKNGLEINQGTKLGISLADLSIVGHTLQGFVLNFRSFNSQAYIQGDVYTLPLNRIRVKAENALGLGSGSTTWGYQDLTTDWVPLFSYSTLLFESLDWANHQLNISYECGKPVPFGNGSLLGEEPDSYNVEIEFEIVPTGSGF